MMIGKIMQNKNAVACYGSGVNVPVAGRVTICEFEASAAPVIYGLSVGLGISDVTAWGGVGFIISVNGREVVSFTDQISDLLRPEFLPIEIQSKQLITIECFNNTAAAITASAFARIEVF